MERSDSVRWAGAVSTALPDVLADLSAETAELDAVLRTLDEAGWHKETPADGWDTHDTIAHLADTNDVMYDRSPDGPRPRERSDATPCAKPVADST